MRIYPPVYTLAAIATMAALDLWAPLAAVIPAPWTGLGALPICTGLGLMAWAALVIHRHGTTLHPFQRATALVTSGPFALSRNPIYLGFALILLGIALALGSATPFAVIPAFIAVVDIHIIRDEERMLAAEFGTAFTTYGARVRRWL